MGFPISITEKPTQMCVWKSCGEASDFWFHVSSVLVIYDIYFQKLRSFRLRAEITFSQIIWPTGMVWAYGGQTIRIKIIYS